jgi:hypothetical protein
MQLNIDLLKQLRYDRKIKFENRWYKFGLSAN